MKLDDPWCVRDLLDVDQVVVRHFPKHEKYDELNKIAENVKIRGVNRALTLKKKVT